MYCELGRTLTAKLVVRFWTSRLQRNLFPRPKLIEMNPWFDHWQNRYCYCTTIYWLVYMFRTFVGYFKCLWPANISCKANQQPKLSSSHHQYLVQKSSIVCHLSNTKRAPVVLRISRLIFQLARALRQPIQAERDLLTFKVLVKEGHDANRAVVEQEALHAVCLRLGSRRWTIDQAHKAPPLTTLLRYT